VTAAIVIGSLVLAGLFLVAWVARPALRSAIEAPKLGFADRVRQYDRACRKSAAERDS